MSAASSQEGLPFSTSLITSRTVEGIGVHPVILAGLVSQDHYSIGLTASISSDGTDISEFMLWWVGPRVSLQLPANRIFPQMSGDVQMSLNFTPSDMFFYPNTSSTQWSSGKEAILRGEFEVHGGEAVNITDLKTMEWVYRISVVVTNNVRQARVMAQVIPISMSVLDSLTDPWSPDICVLSFMLTSSPWSTPPDPAMKFFGPVPVFSDRRSVECKAANIFPGSQKIKKFVSRAMLNCTANPELSEDEVASLLDGTAHPPSRAASVAEWPPVPPDSIPTPTGPAATGCTPSQASQQTRGVPVLAKDQSALSAAAVESMASQAGRPFGDGAVDLPVLSTKAKNRQDVIRNMYPDLPENLPSWDHLADLSLQDCIVCINKKVDQERDTVGEGAESEAFMKATTPVVYYMKQIDDRLSQLHSASFLRAPLSEPPVYWHLIAKKLPQIVTVLPDGVVGTESGVSDFAIKKMSDRTFPLQLKHILKKNSYVEKAAPVSKRRAMEGLGTGEGCGATWIDEYDFKMASFPWEVQEAMMNAILVYQQLFPLDFSMIIINLTLVKYQLFYDAEISTKYQVEICRHFIDSAFLSNSRRARTKTPCLSKKQCEDVAIASLRACNRPGVMPPLRDLAASGGRMEQGHNAASFAAFNLSNLGRAQVQQHLQNQKHQKYQEAGGGYGPTKPRQQGRGGGGGGGRGRGKPAASGSGSRSSIQVCPSFEKGEPCSRGGDPKGSCKTVDGVVLHHVCSICLQQNHATKNHK